MTGSRRVAGGRRNGEIAALPGIRAGTVKRHLENVYRKLGVSRRRAAAMLLAPLMPRGDRRDH
ncbi:LuxR C-terminal-related transcriptional regulator [Dokdonella ginsengisoli]|uniref:LuxR C-terminal-related transcriptional regulator n=1 Tax=Dokdonella ginsengisoli TaxID=363846 RepID=A0ABV9QQW1_9GAMM